VVTAQRRTQDLQEVPVSIVAITGEGLEARGVQSIEGLNGTIPNLNIMGNMGGAGTTSPSFRVRGIPGVGTYVDGIWQVSTNGLLTQEFVDIERVEVLRGPQGTLFGRDSVGGAIRIITKRPSEEFGASFKGTVGTLNRRDSQVAADVPLHENLLTKWTVASLNRDGYIRSLTTGEKGGGVDQLVMRGDILWTPSDVLDVRVVLDTSESQYTEPRVEDAVFLDAILFPTNITNIYNAAGLPFTAETQTAGWPGGEVGKWENRSQTTIPNRIDKDQISAEINWSLTDTLSLQFLTGFVEMGTKNFIDYDNSQYGLVEDTSDQSLDKSPALKPARPR
jgi:iron complex outermembrane receptor protein